VPEGVGEREAQRSADDDAQGAELRGAIADGTDGVVLAAGQRRDVDGHDCVDAGTEAMISTARP
jgi:hypothetical protein